MQVAEVLLISLVFALAVTLVIARIKSARQASRVMGAAGNASPNLEATYHLVSAARLVDTLGLAQARSLLAEPYPTDNAKERPGWWYARRGVARELARRTAVEASLLQSFYGLEIGGEEAPDDAAMIRQAVLSYMMGPARELFPFDDVPTQPPMPLSLYLICRDEEEAHPVKYPGAWNWMTVAEFAKIQNPNVRIGEHFVLEPPKVSGSGASARIRFRWGTPPGVYLQDVEVRKLDEIWVVAAIRDTFKLR